MSQVLDIKAIDKEALLQKPPAEILAIIQEVWAVTPKKGRYDWYFVTTRARNKLSELEVDDPNRLEWAKIWVYVQTQIASSPNALPHDLSDLMRFKADVITTVGEQAAEPIGSVDEIIAWFFASLSMTPEDALSKAEDIRATWKTWKTPSERVLEMRDLRDIRIDLGAIKALENHPKVKNHPELQKWLSIRGRLI